jgi:uncharacterized protein (TIGR02996 family)
MRGFEAELLHAVASEEAVHPDRPLALFPRLVLADWLEDHLGASGHIRAEFIRLQVACEEVGFSCWLPKLPEDPPLRLPSHLDCEGLARGLRLRNMAVAHFLEHTRTLLEPYPPWLREHLVFRGGLPWLCHVPWELWQHRAEEMRLDGSLGRLATVRAWRFSSPIDGPQGFDPLPSLPGKPYSLEVSGVGAATGLFRSGGVQEWLGSLRELTLSRWALPKAMALGILPSAALVPDLRRLGLPANQIEFEQMLDLGRAGLPPGLESFSLGRNRLSFEDSVVFFEEGWALPHLRELDLSGTGVGLGVLYNLGRSPICENLTSLNLSHGEIEETLDVEMLLDAAFQSLRELNLAGNRLRDGFLDTLAQARWLGHLTHLDLSEVPSGGQGWARLIAKLGNSLVELRQGNCGLEADAVGVLAGSPARESLKQLELRQNNLGNEGFLEILTTAWPQMVIMGLGLNSVSAAIPQLDCRLTPWLTAVELERP